MTSRSRRLSARSLVAGMAVAATGAASGLVAQPVHAQERASAERLLSDVRTCQTIAEPDARLACYDSKVAAITAATETGEVRIVDREEIKQTRRSLFGFSMPKIGLFGGSDEENEILETKIVSSRKTGRDSWSFTTAEGAVWEINSPGRRIKPPAAGDKVVFKKAALTSYFIRINDQIGVKGRRVE